MTVTANDSWIQVSGDGAIDEITVDFEFYDSTDLLVTHKVTATGVQTTYVEGTHWNLTAGGSGAGGTITVEDPATNWASGTSLTVTRIEPTTVATDVSATEQIPSATVNVQHDRTTMKLQEVEEVLNRCIKFPVTDDQTLSATLPASVARGDQTLSFDSSGNVQTETSTGAGVVYKIYLGPADATIRDPAAANVSIEGVGGGTNSAIVFTNSSGTGDVVDVSVGRAAELGAGNITAMDVYASSDTAEVSKAWALQIGFADPVGDGDTLGNSDIPLAQFDRPDNADEVGVTSIASANFPVAIAEGQLWSFAFYRIGADVVDSSVQDMEILGFVITFQKS